MPVLALSSGGAATLTGPAAGTNLSFGYTVGAEDTTPSLAAVAVDLNGASILDQYGKAADLTLAVGQPAGVLVINPPETT
jgi:hypothetical protein